MPTFLRLANDRLAVLAKVGGTLTLRLQTLDPAPRELTARIAPPAGGHPETGSGRPTTGSGGVNTRDRFNRGGSDRDDPDR